ncbi:hypothetical protein [Microbulbifer sp. 2205BS26-8]|uniref:hypothetical protein n=1 Tax=Microbulbifer sp. 2205BS26-8 TaxID=3064386 RepID=UPI00273F887A|nr:hypothetical protein [Microbulbifer sp. 2205BS26-8]MDP5210782.1 hypothetical protein [Microbulbifer sp. 2205BS26-8]
MSKQQPLTAQVTVCEPLKVQDIAPFCLLRVAAVPYEMLEALRLPKTEACIESILAAEVRMEECRCPLEDALHAMVPGIDPDDAKFRRKVLGLRRDVHNGRPTKTQEVDCTEISQRLDAAGAKWLREWLDSQAQLKRASDALEPGLLAEIQSHLRPGLRQPMTLATFRRALAFASNRVASSAMTEERLPTPPRPNNLERSLLGYMNRAAAKTSPFSSFMALSVVAVDPASESDYPSAVRAQYISRTGLNRGIFSRFYRSGMQEAAGCGDIKLRLNPTFADSQAGRMQALCDREIVLIGRPWLEQRLAHFRLDPRIVNVLTASPEEDFFHNWCVRLTAVGLNEEQAKQVVTKLLQRNVLMPPPLFDAFDQAPHVRLANLWRDSESPLLREQVPLLKDMADTADRIAVAEGDTRSRAFDFIRDKESQILQALGDGSADSLQNMVLEDCWLSGIKGSMGAKLLRPLDDLQAFLSRQVVVSPYYARLRDHFLREYGEEGVCDDLVGFLLRVGDKLIDIPEFGADLEQTPAAKAPAGAAIPVTAQLQIAAGGEGSEPLMVVNRVFDGAGWLAARYSPGEQAEQRLLRDKLSEWLRRVHHPREPVDLVLSGQCNDLQAHAPLTRRVLRWPGEPLLLDPERVLEASSLRLSYNGDSGLLELCDTDGTPVSLVYLGATFPSPIWGVRYALSILTQPYLLGRPDFRPPPLRDADSVTFESRLTEGSLVLRRATWWISSEYLKREWFNGCQSERLLKVRRECDRHGIPPVVFAQRFIPPERSGLIPADVLSANRKPMWVDLRNPFWLHMLERTAEKSDWVQLSEPLPDADSLWLEVEDRRHVSEVQLEMVVRADPSAQS